MAGGTSLLAFRARQGLQQHAQNSNFFLTSWLIHILSETCEVVIQWYEVYPSRCCWNVDYGPKDGALWWLNSDMALNCVENFFFSALLPSLSGDIYSYCSISSQHSIAGTAWICPKLWILKTRIITPTFLNFWTIQRTNSRCCQAQWQ
jgi:hypothetical protein